MRDEFAAPPPLIVNGREYPLWSQFVHRKTEWIGGALQDLGDAIDRTLFGTRPRATEIIGVKLEANGEKSAWFEVTGKDFSCGFDVAYGGVTEGDEGWITFHGFQGHIWRIKQRDKSKQAPTPDPQLTIT